MLVCHVSLATWINTIIHPAASHSVTEDRDKFLKKHFFLMQHSWLMLPSRSLASVTQDVHEEEAEWMKLPLKLRLAVSLSAFSWKAD